MEARIKLAVWIAGTGKRKREAAKDLGLHYGTLSSFLSGKKEPGAAAKFLIQQNTSGAIRMEDWG